MLSKSIVLSFVTLIPSFDAYCVDKVNEYYYGKCSWFTISGNAAINPQCNSTNYVACRWNYWRLSKELNCSRKEVKEKLKDMLVEVTNISNGTRMFAKPVDWGPNRRTKRAIDLSYDLMKSLGVKTDDTVKFRLMKSMAFKS